MITAGFSHIVISHIFFMWLNSSFSWVWEELVIVDVDDDDDVEEYVDEEFKYSNEEKKDAEQERVGIKGISSLANNNEFTNALDIIKLVFLKFSNKS